MLTLVLALILGLGGVARVYSRQVGQGGKLGLAGFALGIIGTGAALAFLWWGSTSGRFDMMHRDPALAARPVLMMTLGIATLGVGLLLLGITSLSVKTPHGRRALPLVLGLLSILWSITIGWLFYVSTSQGQIPWQNRFFVLFPVVTLLLGGGWIGLGTMLATEADAQISQTPPASA